MKPMMGVLVATVSFVGCGGASYQAVGTPRAASTDALIEVDEIDGGNVEVRMDVTNLTPPDRLGEGLTSYVVWFTPRGSQSYKAGALNYDPDKRRGRLRATFPQRRFDVQVTAEQNRSASTPSELVVVKQMVSVDD